MRASQIVLLTSLFWSGGNFLFLSSAAVCIATKPGWLVASAAGPTSKLGYTPTIPACLMQPAPAHTRMLYVVCYIDGLAAAPSTHTHTHGRIVSGTNHLTDLYPRERERGKTRKTTIKGNFPPQQPPGQGSLSLCGCCPRCTKLSVVDDDVGFSSPPTTGHQPSGQRGCECVSELRVA